MPIQRPKKPMPSLGPVPSSRTKKPIYLSRIENSTIH